MPSNDGMHQDDGIQRLDYSISIPLDGYRDALSFSEEEKLLLRPIAETIAMLDGNAFFTIAGVGESEWYEQYLPEAWALWNANGGSGGWAGEASWAREHRIRGSNEMIRGLHEQYRTALMLAGDGA